ncbi:stress response protein NST1 [Capsicum annuum]|uniref:stress response protein NST1 n=1 Tax=Capsicum annuum TaxID=4072 RepID=UPI001FB163CC|nr:stress response protein NST1 [Capsicum annuum]
MNGESLVESHGRPHTGTKTLRRCNDGLGADHVILIDVELTESFSNVSFIDVPESKPKSWSPFGNIILIDDDDVSNENEYSEFGADDDHRFFHDPSPSMRSCSTSKSAKELRDEIDDDCQFVGENVIPPMKLSKCKRTYSGKVPVQNRHGLMSDDVNGSVDGRVENCITTQRERIKETSKYKKALEEELMSRQRALAIQAEEAKKLKLMLRRKKAESRRLLEMEERQKQRVAEMRETQRKDLENMNLKEPMKAEVQKELSKLELTCHDMASVLRGLGINVGDGTSHEVRVAYKKAVLKFHLDRASQSDIRQQVEAEEKF